MTAEYDTFFLVTTYIPNAGQKLQNHAAKLEAKLTTSENDYFTVSGYGKLVGTPIHTAEAIRLGKLATKLSNQAGVGVGSIKDARYGTVGTYHADILKQIINPPVI